MFGALGDSELVVCLKDRQVDQGELGVASPPAFVGDRHVGYDVLHAIIHEEASATHGDFCQRQGGGAVRRRRNVVLTQIAYAVDQNWTDPQNGLFHDMECSSETAGGGRCHRAFPQRASGRLRRGGSSACNAIR